MHLLKDEFHQYKLVVRISERMTNSTVNARAVFCK